jgi:hypothetical protein
VVEKKFERKNWTIEVSEVDLKLLSDLNKTKNVEKIKKTGIENNKIY